MKGVQIRLGLLLSPTEKMIFLSLYYWRDVVAREYGIEENIIIEMMNQLNSFFL